MPPSEITPRWMKLRLASRHCGLSVRTLERRLSEECFASKLVGAVRLIDRESLDAWIDSQPSATSGFRGKKKTPNPA
ncbi:hypothetical protein OKA04_23270 [Luteolibacter flavescens]|uniref:Helix-turn-helix domain-containing protein n=1 Tax=Luteolibacter flavescens TaxID=1859460 RepID=A0ABT3FW97_9BACT|nr:hypothetical protein [Luteolibacter flavescens]MCW1887677.1 hypothetical protein [Luteolibacter flavescens]